MLYQLSYGICNYPMTLKTALFKALQPESIIFGSAKIRENRILPNFKKIRLYLRTLISLILISVIHQIPLITVAVAYFCRNFVGSFITKSVHAFNYAYIGYWQE